MAERDVERVLDLLATVEKVLKDDVAYSKLSERDPATLEATVGAAEQALAVGWARWRSGDSDIHAARMTAVLLQLGMARAAFRQSSAAQRDKRIFGLSTFLHNLRSYATVPDLIDRVPTEVNKLGLSRVLVSRVLGGQWIARSAAVVDEMELARDMVRVGTEHPGTLTGAMVETEMVRRRVPILVHEAEGHPRVHPQLRSLIDCHAYVSAPIMVSGKAAGLVHADQNVDTGTVDEADRDLIGTVAEGLGFAIERTVFQERLMGLRKQLDDHHRAVNELIDEFTEADGELWPGNGSPVAAPTSSPHVAPRSDDGICLTPREVEVLRHMALGQTNAQIASNLFVSEGTVKTHAKHILRKLGAANRAEAVSRYHMMTRRALNQAV
ncbi:LuxR C-terminal-related transcriptional regulator [Amycolatopsis sp.]|uniref:LuxR C-terminal-related transcriptional regulator n=1 Tax=Amycolatopsis sp. TaxID=37632 RepID=UPI002BB037F2|nr:LuxR C-terminal-related transcriptional regulator [Amycolatopsis sp.]HVV08309.1 LuxR C-terminal-related transcriptional regulator [Amycolatopsis sp.]